MSIGRFFAGVGALVWYPPLVSPTFRSPQKPPLNSPRRCVRGCNLSCDSPHATWGVVNGR